MPARIAASARRNGIGRCSEIQAVPIDISASAIVSQPFSSANVSASASAPSVPVANSAVEIIESRPALAAGEDFGRAGEGCGKDHGEDRKRDRAVEMSDARIERDQQRERNEGRRADHTTGMIALDERPWARNPARPKPAAKSAAATRCSVTD